MTRHLSTSGSVPRPADLRQIIERIRRVPDGSRTFTEPELSLARLYRVPPTLLTQLLDAGMPHRGSGQGRRFDRYDLANVGLWLGLPCAQRQVMRWWSRAMTAAVPGRDAHFTLGIVGVCPSPGHDGGCRFALDPRFEAATAASPPTELSPGSYTVEVALPCEQRYFEPPFTALLEPAARLWFHYLPTDLDRDIGFAADTGLANCHLATRYLVHLASGMGLPVRRASGYFLTPPYGTEHVWPEFEVDGRWWPADPFMLTSLARWGVLDPRQWPPNRSPQGFFWRLGAGHVKVLRHRDTLVHPQPTVSLHQ